MTKTIFKYRIPDSFGKFELELPRNSKIFTFQEQETELLDDDGLGYIKRSLNIWVLLNPNKVELTEKRYFQLIGTGCEIKGDIVQYIGTVLATNSLVYHLFEVQK